MEDNAEYPNMDAYARVYYIIILESDNQRVKIGTKKLIKRNNKKN